MHRLLLLVMGCLFLLVASLGFCSMVRAESMQEEFNGKTFNPELTYGFKDTRWTSWNKFAISSYVLANVADIYTTQEALDRGCIEGNPIMPESVLGAIAVKLLLSSAIYYSVEKWVVPKHGTKARNYTYITMATVLTAISINNNSCGR